MSNKVIMPKKQRVRVLITGSRTWTDEALMRKLLIRVWNKWPHAERVLVHGDAPGADRMAAKIWKDMGGRLEPHPAPWQQHTKACGCDANAAYCRQAGFRRNEAMVRLGADMCLAFIKDRSKGASHTAALADKAGIPTLRVEQ